MNQAPASLVRILWRATNLTGAERASHSLFLRRIFLGNILLRYLMRANFPLISARSVFQARHSVGFKRGGQANDS